MQMRAINGITISVGNLYERYEYMAKHRRQTIFANHIAFVVENI